MKFVIQKQAFIIQLNHVTRAIPSKATIPILQGIKITATNEGITLIGSDADISIESFLPVDNESYDLSIEEEGSIVLPARLFNDIIKKLPKDEVVIESDDFYHATITSGSATFNINGQDSESYPRLPDIEIDQQINLPPLLFKQMVDQTVFATSNQESRPVLTGIHLTANASSITAAATDSHRLSLREIPTDLPNGEDSFKPITIPKKTMVELTRMIDDNGKLAFAVTEQQVIFFLENLTIFSRLLEGNYPDVYRLIPSSHQTELVLNANNFLQAIDRASLMSHESKNNVVQLEIGEDNVELSVKGNQVGHVAEEIDYKKAEGDAIIISFNPDYMKDALKSFGDVDIKIQFQSSIRPLLMSQDLEDEVPHSQLLQLLTPIRTHHS
ncbi:DNA polymerase III subunit beta [Fundicoccus culcitae]|uniref:Beta sliding clamp n=1 Tax=Fundicoccus culcitae TaxID=2969821 RepID=A0ABY5P2W7_9LACT|nr:DNA polymerase III subunit beta [Fundicoccus culcitae]UUX33071.1 DNA polymerase III subunit beta [Fundicoccus culcitae]